MEQILLIVAIALLVWVAAGIGRETGPVDREAFAGPDGHPSEKPPTSEAP